VLPLSTENSPGVYGKFIALEKVITTRVPSVLVPGVPEIVGGGLLGGIIMADITAGKTENTEIQIKKIIVFLFFIFKI
jgi:hypothetical protein